MMQQHDCWFRDGRCIFCDASAESGQRHALSMCRIQFGDGSGYVCPKICGGCRAGKKLVTATVQQ